MVYEPAPIVVSVYTRINHFKRCIEALQKNLLADKSTLYVYSDASSRKEDDVLVHEVRCYAHHIDGFRKVYVIERDTNYGGTRNACLAHREVTDKMGKSIFMEDDIVTAPGFLTFMNEALEFYRGDENILSISGYCPPIHIPEDYQKDIFILPRFCGWGLGTWQAKNNQIPPQIDPDEFQRLKNKRKLFKVGGNDVLPLIWQEVNGQLDAQDVRYMYHQALYNKYTIYPVKSLVQNIGNDGSGVHCKGNDKFDHNELSDKHNNFKFLRDIKLDVRIQKANYEFRNIGLKGNIVFYLQQLGIYPYLKNIRKMLMTINNTRS